MKTIHKFNLNIATKFTAPSEGKPLSVQYQNGQLTLWLEVEKENREVDYQARIIGTGQDFSKMEGYSYISTVQDSNGLVWHIYFKELFPVAIQTEDEPTA
jgi:hypothetical protein